MSFSEIIQGKTRRQFINEDSISKHLFCSICHEVFEEPQRLICGHTFCYACIANWGFYNHKCPECKQMFGKRKLQRDLIASKMVDELQVKCSHEQCKWEGIYSVLKKHQRRCVWKPRKEPVALGNVPQISISDTEDNTEVIIVEKRINK